MGKGDRKTAKGKRYNASYGNARPHQTLVNDAGVVAAAANKSAVVAKKAAVKKVAVKKAPAKKASA